MASDRLNVIALISGGKDSFFSVLHCLHHGHRIVALANLFPGTSLHKDRDAEAGDEDADAVIQFIDPAGRSPGPDSGVGSDRDLNSFMYQTVGHEVVPLYAAATGLPLYRQAISRSGALHHERDYQFDTDASGATRDETESMLSLLKAIVTRHPEANALCAGAILSTYQRTRVESVARRLGLAPLAFLWQYPVLAPDTSTAAARSASVEGVPQLLSDMANAGLEARIVKVASAGLDEDHLWERVSSDAGARRVRSALRKFGNAEGAAALGEGGEFETLVVDGPTRLFRKRICVPDEGRRVVRDGGGSSWLMLRGARLEDKVDPGEKSLVVRTPDLLDPKFNSILEMLPGASTSALESKESSGTSSLLRTAIKSSSDDADLLRWSVFAEPSLEGRSIREETVQIVQTIRQLLSSASLDASQITNTVIILRRMSDFPLINDEYSKLFTKPNPPSRVTISCGDLLPDGRDIGVYLMIPSSQAMSERNGLHVQSRSYWAPANIGPYSQAIDIPITVSCELTGLRSVSIAGQIPLIPATMLLPPPSETSHQLQVVLSLQHLWRVALEMKVQYWTSAVAYFARASSATEMERSARLVGSAWRQIHSPPEDEDDADNGPDPWDLKYNPQFASFGGNDEQKKPRSLPDWSVLTLRQQNEPEACVPPVFAAEVEELPRQAAIEWHAHTGLSQVGESSVEMTYYSGVGTPGWRAWHFIVKGDSAALVYTTVACGFEEQPESANYKALEESTGTVYQESLRRLLPNGLEVARQQPYLAYVDAGEVQQTWASLGGSCLNTAVVPCRSIWSPDGKRLKAVTLYKLNFHS